MKDCPVLANSVINEDTSEEDVVNMEHKILITTMIEESSLEPIQEIKQNQKLRKELEERLARLVKETTLDKMQLISFIDALRNPVHLTVSSNITF